MIIKNLLLLAFGLCSVPAWGQLQINAPLFIGAGATMTIAEGNVAATADILGPGTFVLAADAPQELDMAGHSIANLEINNPAGILLAGNTSIDGQLTFTNGSITLGTSNLSFTATGNAGNYSGTGNKYIITDGTGLVKKEGLAMNATFTFPVGRAANDYTPASITNLNAAGRTFNMQVRNYTESAPAEGNTTYGMDRTWQITSDIAGLSTVDLTHNDVTNIAGISSSGIDFDPSVTYITQQMSPGVWSSTGNRQNGGTPVNTISDNLIVPAAPDATSYFTKSSALIVPLPLDLLSFEAKKSGKNSAAITWTTAIEKSLNYFEVERSAEGSVFEAITGRVTAKEEASEASYTIMDTNPLKGMNYYRLKIVYIDGSHKNSQTRTVDFSNLNNYVLAPNPATDHLSITGSFIDATVEIVSTTGQRISRQNITGSSAYVNLATLAAGTYYLLVSEKGIVKFNQKFIKQ